VSGDTFIAYFGLRFEIRSEEIESIELRSDPRVVAARKAGLKYYWGNFGGGLQERFLLFIGYQIGILGAENSQEVSLSLHDAESSFNTARRKLAEAGFAEIPGIHLCWQPDI
jgi:hypothetical protein